MNHILFTTGGRTEDFLDLHSSTKYVLIYQRSYNLNFNIVSEFYKEGIPTYYFTHSGTKHYSSIWNIYSDGLGPSLSPDQIPEIL